MKKCIDCENFLNKHSTSEHLCQSPKLVSYIHGGRLVEKCIHVRRDTDNDFASTLCGSNGGWFIPILTQGVK